MPVEPVIWVVDDDPSIRWVLSKALIKAGFTVRNFAAVADAPGRLVDQAPAAVFTDLRMPGTSGLALMQALHDRRADIPVVVMTAYSDLDSAVAAYRGGAFEYLPKPFDLDDAVSLARRALAARTARSSEIRVGQLQVQAMLGAAPAIQDVFRVIGRLSQSTMTVLIRGESGTGKELVARALYDNSPRAGRPFIAINTAAIPAELLESELFGHERGAFTGAHAQRKGRFEQADGGTLFLDEIGDMPAVLQTRLLRVLSEGRFYRVGGHQQIAVDVRVIAATNQDLEARVEDGRFRADLYHRLNVVQITVPALRARRDDIAPLAVRFLGDAAREIGTEAKTLGAALRWLAAWPMAGPATHGSWKTCAGA